MKRFMQVLSVMCVAAIAQAVDFEKVDSMNLSSPGSIKPMAQRLDRNFEAAETVLDALSTTYQPLDSDLTDLADGSLTGSKVGTGIPAGNVTSGNLPVAVMTNALAGTAYTTNTLTGDGVTNVFIWATVGPVKVLRSITTTP